MPVLPIAKPIRHHLRCHRPLLTQRPLSPVVWDDLFLVLGCDGIWDVLDDQRTVEIAADALSEGGASAAAAAVVRGEHDRLQSTVFLAGLRVHTEWRCVSQRPTTSSR